MSDTDSADFGVETIDGHEPGVIIAVHGQADLHTAPQLREAMTTAIDGGATSLIVDLSDATFVDSMTLGVLLGAVKRLRPHGGKVAVVCVSPAHPQDLRDHAARSRLRAPRDARRRAAGRAIPRMSDPADARPPARTAVEFPARDGYRGVASLVLGGVAARFELPVDRVDDLLLGVDSLLMQGVVEDVARVEATASETDLTVRVGVFRRGQLDDAAVRRVVARLVDTVREVPADGGAWIELGMSVARRDGA